MLQKAWLASNSALLSNLTPALQCLFSRMTQLSLLHSEELLAYLLDGLHEDLNLVKVERKEPLRRLCMPSVHGEVGCGTMRCQAMPI